MNPTDQIAAEFEQWLIKTFGVTWERSGIMHQFKTAIEKAVEYHVRNNTDFIKGVREALATQSRAAQASEQSVIAPTKEFMEAQSPQANDTKRLIEALIFIRDNANHGVLKAVATDTLKSIGIDAAMSQTKEKE